jgi:WD40 repeat protein
MKNENFNLSTSRISDKDVRKNESLRNEKFLYEKKLPSLLSELQDSEIELIPETIREHENIICICHSHNNALIGGSKSGKLVIWKDNSRALEYRSKNTINTVIHGKIHQRVYAGTDQGIIIRWAYAQTQKSIVELNGHKKGVTSLVLLSDDSVMISGGKDSKIMVWYLAGKKKPIEFNKHKAEVTKLVTNAEETKLISCSLDGLIIIWNIESLASIYDAHILTQNHGVDQIELFESTLISVTVKGKLIKWSLEDYSQTSVIELPSKIVSMCKSTDNRYLYFVLSSAIDFSIRVICIEKIDSEKIYSIPSAHDNVINCLCNIPNTNKLVTASKDNTLKIWNFNEDYTERLLIHTEADINCITVDETLELVMIGDNNGKILLYKLNGEKLRRELNAYSKCNINSIIVTFDKKYIIAACEDQKILVWRPEYKSGDPEFEFGTDKGHSESVLSICSSIDKKYLFSVSSDKSIKVWDVLYQKFYKSLGENKNDENGEKTEIFGHKDEVIDIKATTRFIFSGSSDGFIIIWDFKTFKQLKKLEFGAKISSISASLLENCVAAAGKSNNIKLWWDFTEDTGYTEELIGHKSEVIRIILCGKENLLYSASKDYTIKIWSVDQATILFSILIEDLSDIAVAETQKYIYAVQNNPEKSSKSVKSIENPLYSNKIIIYPSKYSYFFKSYAKKIQLHESNVYDEYWEDYIIFPHAINLSYIFISSNRPSLLKTGFASELKFLKNKNFESPLSWALQRNNTQCADVILKKLSKTDLNHKRVIIESIEKEMNKLISSNLSCLPLLYENLFVVVTENVEATGKLKLSAPMVLVSSLCKVEQEEFLDRTVFSEKKKEFLEYRKSLCKFHFDLGSIESIKLLISIADCHNPELFRTQLLKAYLDFKWKQTRFILIFETIIYCISLLILTWYVISPQRHSEILKLNLILVLSTISLLKNLNKIYKAPYKSITNAWNILDLARILVAYYYYSNQIFYEDLQYSALELLTLCWWVRAVGYFRLFNKYRYLLRVIMEIIKDMIPFFLILFTSTIGFAMLLCVSQSDISFYNAFVNVYLLDQTDFVFDMDSIENILVFFMASLLNPIIMLNLLIAIMGDTYDRVQEDQIVADYREMTELILEAEYLAFWSKNNKAMFKYIIRSDYMRNLNLEKNQWMGKIRAVKKSLQSLEDKFKASSKNIDHVQVNLFEKLNDVASVTASLNRRLKEVSLENLSNS